MVYAVTFQPAADDIKYMDEMTIGSTDCGISEKACFNEKGTNVSIILNELGIPTRTLVFAAVFTQETIENGIAQMGLDNLSDGDTIVLSGSIPDGVPMDIYEKILEYLSAKNIRAVVDVEGNILLNLLKYKPFLVKINNDRLANMFDVLIRNDDEALEYASVLKRMGAHNVLVSRGGSGAVLLDENGKDYICRACEGTVKNKVGAGDSLVAGFIAGAQKGDYRYALKLGNAAAGATVFSDGLAQKEEIFRLLDQLEHMKYGWT